MVNPHGRDSMSYWSRFASAMAGPRLAGAMGLSLLLSAQFLIQPFNSEFWSLLDIGTHFLDHAIRLALAAALMVAAFTLADEAIPTGTAGRLPILLLAVAAASLTGTALFVDEWFFGADARSTDLLRASLPLLALGSIATALHERRRNVVRRRADVQAAQQATAELAREGAEQSLQLLEAQIEPHFLFNTLANIRSLFRTTPDAGQQMLGNLQRYLRRALPRIRAGALTLEDEIELVRAYLELFAVRMRPRLSFEIEVAPGAAATAFPGMLLLTLVENAVKHGVAPAERPCCISVHARREGDVVRVEVADDGVGLQTVAAGGGGVGLANVQRRLLAHYGRTARFALLQRQPRGVVAIVTVPAGSTVQ